MWFRISFSVLIGTGLAVAATVAVGSLPHANAYNYNSTPNSDAVPSCEGLRICPFDDLTTDEIRLVHRVVLDYYKHHHKQHRYLHGSGSRTRMRSIKFPIIRAQEPSKDDWLSGQETGRARRAFAAVFDEDVNQITEFVIELLGASDGRIERVRKLPPGITPPLLLDEFVQAEKIVRTSREWVAALHRRGLNPENARLDIWAPGTLSGPEEEGADKRILRAITDYQDPVSRFWYWAVVEGLIVNVDLQTGRVVSVWDDEYEIIPLTSGFEEDPALFANKPPLKPLHIDQPEGSSIVVDGQQLSWYKWKLRYSVDPVHGLQLYHLTYNGDCAQRSVTYKLSLAELSVPYGAKGRAWRWRSAFDAGEYGLGKLANPLVKGVDVPENALLFDCVIADDRGGEPIAVPGCVAAYERDYGLLYKHTDTNTGDADGKRGRSLVITFMSTIGNYDYGFDYVFQQDGRIEPRVRLTGIILARGVSSPTENDPNCITSCSNLLNDHLYGPAHQHFFNYRIDFDVDGVHNHFLEVDVVPDALGLHNPAAGAFSPRNTIVAQEGHRDHDLHKHRTWRVVNSNPGHRNLFGTPRGYALWPESVSFTYLTDVNPIMSHAAFVKHPVWVTKYKDDEQSATSVYPRTGFPHEGLPQFVGDGEGLENEDLVVWYTHGITHLPRPEEWPIMNVGPSAGFSLVPFSFLSQNSEMPLKGRCP